MSTPLTDRQLREVEYHRKRAEQFREIIDKPISWQVVENPAIRWWNSAWQMFYHLKKCGIQGKNVLVIGCGFGDDALFAAKMGASVSAFDISVESLEIAKLRAEKHHLEIDFRESPAESTPFPSGFFDVVLARDILHHVEIELAMKEVCRISKPDAVFIASEIYTHTLLEKLRRNKLVDKYLYPRMRKHIYRNPTEDYTTEDEEKLTQKDVRVLQSYLEPGGTTQYFNFIIARIVPKGSLWMAKMDRLFLKLVGPLGALLAGRVLLRSRLSSKPPNSAGGSTREFA
jgi:2-polyprenyl-3-methyl-5-hydroxy-6-metoxy-1,4-benzoquinol methylase